MDYDSLLAKVIASGKDRRTAIQRLERALNEFQIGGLPTDLDFLKQIIESKPFRKGEVTTTYLDSFTPRPPEKKEDLQRLLALAAALYIHSQRAVSQPIPQDRKLATRWMYAAWREQMTGAW